MRQGLTHWGRVTHIYASLNWVIIGSDNGLSPVRRQAIIWTNAGILLIEPLGTNFREILIGIQTFSFKNVVCKMASFLSRPQWVNQPVFVFRICNSNSNPKVENSNSIAILLRTSNSNSNSGYQLCRTIMPCLYELIIYICKQNTNDKFKLIESIIKITAPAGAGVTKVPFVNFSASKILDLAKVPLRFFESRIYLTGAPAAELRWHLSNINVIFNG